MKKVYTALLLVLLTLSLSGCLGENSMKEEISIALGGSPSTVDPQLITDELSSTVVSFCYSTLYQYDNTGVLIPCLAKDYDLSEDGCTYTFHLKENLKWSDGRPLTAEDFVFAFRRLADPDTGSNAIYLITDNSMILNAKEINAGEIPVSELGVSSPDETTLVVKLEEPCPYFCSLLAKPNFSPCNEDFYYSAGSRFASSSDTLLYSGAYIMDQYEPLAQQIHFTKNPYFVNADTITVPGITLQVVANSQQAIMCYEAGDIDITAVGSGLAELTDGDPDLHVFPKASVSYIVENSRDCPELHNRNIRMAITKSLDRNNLAENVIRTGSFPMTRVNPPNFYKETDGTDFSEDAGRYEKYCSYDPADAAALWEQGLNELGVSEITLNFVYSSSLGNVVEALAAQMKEALPGLELELTPLPFKEMLQRKSKGEYDLMLSGWIADYVDPTSFLGLFISTFDYGYGNPEYDELYSQIQSARYAQSPDERNELMHEAEDMLMEDAAVIPLYMNGSSYLIDKEVNGFVLTPTGDSWVITSLTKEVK